MDIFISFHFTDEPKAPAVIEAPQPVTKRAVLQEATLTCRVSGVPEPEITWKHNGAVITGWPYTLLPSGDLRITVSSM